MANFYRLVLFLGLVLFGGGAFAASPITQYKLNLRVTTNWYSSKDAACNTTDLKADVDTVSAADPRYSFWVTSATATSETACVYHYGYSINGTVQYQDLTTTEFINSRQWCANGTQPVQNVCPDVVTPTRSWSEICATITGAKWKGADPMDQIKFFSGSNGSMSPRYMCEGKDIPAQYSASEKPANSGCMLVLDPIMKVKESEGYFLYGPGKWSGQACSTATAGNGMGGGIDSGSSPEQPRRTASTVTTVGTDGTKTCAGTSFECATDAGQCKAGFVPGQVNGVTICVPAGASGKPVETVQKKTESVTVNRPDGSTFADTRETTKQTVCDGGQCTTTTTQTVGTGNGYGGSPQTSTSTEVQSKGAYCVNNPADPQCKSGQTTATAANGSAKGTGDGAGDSDSSWGGSCTAGFQCSGDAVMCAIAHATWQTKCAFFDRDSPESQVYADAKAAAAASSPVLPITTVSLGVADFDHTSAFGVGEACVPDKVVTVAHFSLTLPLSAICPHLGYMGTVLMMFGWLLAAGIVFGSVKG